MREEFFAFPPQAARADVDRADHRRQPGFANAESRGRRELAAVEGRADASDSSDRRRGLRRTGGAIPSSPDVNGEISPFSADMPAAFAEADLVVSRAGMGTVSELAAAGQAVDSGAAADGRAISISCAMPRHSRKLARRAWCWMRR